MQYEDMTIRAYEITFACNVRHPDNNDYTEVYQGRSVSEAVKAAEIECLGLNSYPASRGGATPEEAWNEHWDLTACKPSHFVSNVRDLGEIKNVEVLV